MTIKQIINYFKSGNVCVTGLRGTGKDVLFGNVISRINKPYLSNLDYSNGKNFQKLEMDKLDCGKNTYKEFISGDIRKYVFPYEKGSDIYLSDAGVYFPSQYCSQLNNQFPYFPVYMALSRQVSHNNFHINVQNLNRCWDKIREQSDIYIRCRKCIVLFGVIVIQGITIYDKYQSCLDRVEPCRIKKPMINKDRQQQADLYLDKFYNTYGSIKKRMLIYINRSKHDTYYFEKLLEGGK